MAVSSGPKITKDGLVLYLDAANFESFRGEPTTNLKGTLLSSSITPSQNYTLTTRTWLNNISVPQEVPLDRALLIRMDTGGINSKQWYWINQGDYQGKTITFSWWVKSLSGDANDTICIAEGGYSSGYTQTSYVATSEWKKVSVTRTINTTNSITLGSGPNAFVLDKSIIYTGFQLEEKSYPTRFTLSTRGTTVATGGGWADMTNNGNHGELINGASYNSGSLGALSFDGVNDRIEINNNELARIGTGNHTIMAWVNNDIVTEEDFIGTGGTSTGNVLLMIYSQAGGGSGGFRGHAWGSTGNPNTLDSPRAIGTGNWNLLVQRVEWGGNIDLFENGIKTATKILVGSAPSSSASKFIIGARSTSTGNSHFDGKISNVMVFNRALTDAEVKQIYEATRARYGL